MDKKKINNLLKGVAAAGALYGGANAASGPDVVFAADLEETQSAVSEEVTESVVDEIDTASATVQEQTQDYFINESTLASVDQSTIQEGDAGLSDPVQVAEITVTESAGDDLTKDEADEAVSQLEAAGYNTKDITVTENTQANEQAEEKSIEILTENPDIEESDIQKEETSNNVILKVDKKIKDTKNVEKSVQEMIDSHQAEGAAEDDIDVEYDNEGNATITLDKKVIDKDAVESVTRQLVETYAADGVTESDIIWTYDEDGNASFTLDKCVKNTEEVEKTVSDLISKYEKEGVTIDAAEDVTVVYDDNNNATITIDKYTEDTNRVDEIVNTFYEANKKYGIGKSDITVSVDENGNTSITLDKKVLDIDAIEETKAALLKTYKAYELQESNIFVKNDADGQVTISVGNRFLNSEDVNDAINTLIEKYKEYGVTRDDFSISSVRPSSVCLVLNKDVDITKDVENAKQIMADNYQAYGVTKDDIKVTYDNDGNANLYLNVQGEDIESVAKEVNALAAKYASYGITVDDISTKYDKAAGVTTVTLDKYVEDKAAQLDIMLNELANKYDISKDSITVKYDENGNANLSFSKEITSTITQKHQPKSAKTGSTITVDGENYTVKNCLYTVAYIGSQYSGLTETEYNRLPEESKSDYIKYDNGFRHLSITNNAGETIADTNLNPNSAVTLDKLGDYSIIALGTYTGESDISGSLYADTIASEKDNTIELKKGKLLSMFENDYQSTLNRQSTNIDIGEATEDYWQKYYKMLLKTAENNGSDASGKVLNLPKQTKLIYVRSENGIATIKGDSDAAANDTAQNCVYVVDKDTKYVNVSGISGTVVAPKANVYLSGFDDENASDTFCGTVIGMDVFNDGSYAYVDPEPKEWKLRSEVISVIAEDTEDEYVLRDITARNYTQSPKIRAVLKGTGTALTISNAGSNAATVGQEYFSVAYRRDSTPGYTITASRTYTENYSFDVSSDIHIERQVQSKQIYDKASVEAREIEDAVWIQKDFIEFKSTISPKNINSFGYAEAKHIQDTVGVDARHISAQGTQEAKHIHETGHVDAVRIIKAVGFSKKYSVTAASTHVLYGERIVEKQTDTPISDDDMGTSDTGAVSVTFTTAAGNTIQTVISQAPASSAASQAPISSTASQAPAAFGTAGINEAGITPLAVKEDTDARQVLGETRSVKGTRSAEGGTVLGASRDAKTGDAAVVYGAAGAIAGSGTAAGGFLLGRRTRDKKK